MKLRLLHEYFIIKRSKLFDHVFYLTENPDVRCADVDPIWHFVCSGWKESRNPNRNFDVKFYITENLDVRLANTNPFVHYIKFGIQEGRLPNDEKNISDSKRLRLGTADNDTRTVGKNLPESTNIIGLIIKTGNSLRTLGIIATLNKVKKYLFPQKEIVHFSDEFGWKGNLSASEIVVQKTTKFARNVKISIVVPLYNTPISFLTELVMSVLNQTYSNWELCLADGSDMPNEQIRDLIISLANEKRIKYQKIGINKGIALNTTVAYRMATGEFIVLLDHDDILSIDALFELVVLINKNPEAEIIYSDRAIFSQESKRVLAYHYLPGFSPDYLRSMNYMSHLLSFSKKLLNQVGFERQEFDGSQDYDLLLRCIEATKNIFHIPKVLYYCRASSGSVALDPKSKLFAYKAGEKAIGEHLERIGYPGRVEFLEDLYAYRIHYEISPKKVSILIPNKDNVNYLKRCISSILNNSTYNNFEIAIIENNSKEEDTFLFYDSIRNDRRVKILMARSNEFNYSMLNNFGVAETQSDFILLLNNDTEVITPSWIEEMLMFAQRKDVGAVGAKLLYENHSIQHCGLVIGLGGDVVNNYGYRKNENEPGYMNSLLLPQNYTAVTGACLMVKRSAFLQVGGFDEKSFKVALNDVDFCLKLRELGLFNVWTPYAQLFHFEGSTRGTDEQGVNKIRYQEEIDQFRLKWSKYFTDGDPFERKNFRGW